MDDSFERFEKTGGKCVIKLDGKSLLHEVDGGCVDGSEAAHFPFDLRGTVRTVQPFEEIGLFHGNLLDGVVKIIL